MCEKDRMLPPRRLQALGFEVPYPLPLSLPNSGPRSICHGPNSLCRKSRVRPRVGAMDSRTLKSHGDGQETGSAAPKAAPRSAPPHPPPTRRPADQPPTGPARSANDGLVPKRHHPRTGTRYEPEAADADADRAAAPRPRTNPPRMDATRAGKDRQGNDVRRERPRRRRLVRQRRRLVRRRQHPRLRERPLLPPLPQGLRRSLAEVSPDEDYGGHLGCWNDVGHRTQADAARLYDVTIARVATAG